MLALAKAQLVNPRSTEEYCEIILGCKVCSASNKNNWRSLIPNSAQAHVKFANSRLLKDRRTLGSCKRINDVWMKSNSGNLNLAHPQVMLAMCCERKRWSSAGCAPKWAKAPINVGHLGPSNQRLNKGDRADLQSSQRPKAVGHVLGVQISINMRLQELLLNPLQTGKVPDI
mmetsp:Transcript_85684/g.149558  ORF Transcript_85684/g.149558 Transcript_85684/m.149558 type:complete len:172 (+) Transcript_85684:688-1203(+)